MLTNRSESVAWVEPQFAHLENFSQVLLRYHRNPCSLSVFYCPFMVFLLTQQISVGRCNAVKKIYILHYHLIFAQVCCVCRHSLKKLKNCARVELKREENLMYQTVDFEPLIYAGVLSLFLRNAFLLEVSLDKNDLLLKFRGTVG